MDSTARYRARLVVINLIAMLTEMGLAGTGRSLYITTEASASMATGLLFLMLGGVVVLMFSTLTRHLAQEEHGWTQLKQSRHSLWMNAMVCAGMPLILVFGANDGLALLRNAATPIWFRLALGLSMFATLLCSALILQHYTRLDRALKG